MRRSILSAIVAGLFVSSACLATGCKEKQPRLVNPPDPKLKPAIPGLGPSGPAPKDKDKDK